MAKVRDASRLHVYLPGGLLKDVKRLAVEMDVSHSELARVALQEYLERHVAELGRPPETTEDLEAWLAGLQERFYAMVDEFRTVLVRLGELIDVDGDHEQ